ncbi:MAG: LysM peptidoglycan-binding domain-containing protein [Chloroflexi bacterium]|nr:LysM peptidoglycan-binding domain-containing protein [Chloroflexota bacterium]
MLKKTILGLALVVIAALALSACERSASPASLPTPTIEGGGPVSIENVDDPMEMLQAYATMTAIAEGGQPAETTPTPTVDPLAQPSGAETTALPSLTPSPTPVIAGSVTLAAGAPTAIINRPATYTLQQGEYPFCIARRFNVNQYELLDANGLTLSQGVNLPVGYTLTIPQTGTPFSGTRVLHTHPTTYTVQLNDTIYRVACYFGDLDPSLIITTNNLVSPFTLQVGQQLNIP